MVNQGRNRGKIVTVTRRKVGTAIAARAPPVSTQGATTHVHVQRALGARRTMRSIPDVTYAHWGDIQSKSIVVAVAAVAAVAAVVEVAEEAAISSVTAR